MRKKLRMWKSYAKEMLRGNYAVPIFGMIAITGINTVASGLTGVLFGGTSWLSILLGQIFLFVVSLIMSIFSAGLSYMFLNIARGKPYSIGDLLYFFKNHPDRVIVSGFVLGLVDVLVSLPYYYISLFTEPGNTPEAALLWLEKGFAMLLLAAALRMLITLPFAVTYYALADDKNLGGMEGLKESARMMRKNMGKYLALQISFIPLLFLSVFTMYIALLWIMPYMEMSSVMFYRDLRGEFAPKPPTEVTPYPLIYENAGGLPGEQREESLQEQSSETDDYNSEA